MTPTISFAGSPITTAAQMDALLGYALSDTGTPLTEKRVRLPFLPWLELHDRLTITADGVRFTADQSYSVTGVSPSRKCAAPVTSKGEPSAVAMASTA